MMSKLTHLQELILIHVALLGRSDMKEIAEKCNASLQSIRRSIPLLEKLEMVKSFNIGRISEANGKRAGYYKLYGIHYKYIDNMRKFFVTFQHTGTDDPIIPFSFTEGVQVSFVMDGDKYEWAGEIQCFLKNGKPMGVVEEIKKQTADWMRSKKSLGKTILLPRHINEEETAKVKGTVREVQRSIEERIFLQDCDGD